MGPKKKFSRKQLIDNAFEIAREEGIDSISIRKVANRVGGSIAPIYVNFKDVDELKQVVVEKAYGIARDYYTREYTGVPFLDMGIGSYRFAMDYKVLFQDLVMKDTRYMRSDRQGIKESIEQMRKDPEFKDFSDEELGDILLKMSIFQLGLVTMVTNDLAPEDLTEDLVVELLSSVGEAVIASAHIRTKERASQKSQGEKS